MKKMPKKWFYFLGIIFSILMFIFMQIKDLLGVYSRLSEVIQLSFLGIGLFFLVSLVYFLARIKEYNKEAIILPILTTLFFIFSLFTKGGMSDIFVQSSILIIFLTSLYYIFKEKVVVNFRKYLLIFGLVFGLILISLLIIWAGRYKTVEKKEYPNLKVELVKCEYLQFAPPYEKDSRLEFLFTITNIGDRQAGGTIWLFGEGSGGSSGAMLERTYKKGDSWNETMSLSYKVYPRKDFDIKMVYAEGEKVINKEEEGKLIYIGSTYECSTRTVAHIG